MSRFGRFVCFISMYVLLNKQDFMLKQSKPVAHPFWFIMVNGYYDNEVAIYLFAFSCLSASVPLFGCF